MIKINKHYKEIKKALKKSNYANPFSLGRYSFSPYMACEHACTYCDGRAEKYYVEGEFDKDIIIRKNLPELLEKELPKLRENAIISIGSGITDVYQPVEKEEKLMQKCAETLSKEKFPVSLITKSSLILRDLDLWKKINKKSGVILSVSLTFLNDEIREIFEPGASPISERLELIKTFKESGIKVGVLMMPLIPMISDTSENIQALYKELKNINVDFIMPGGLTLRPGKQKDHFLDIIKSNYPEFLNNFNNIYNENRPSGNSTYLYRQELSNKFQKAYLKYQMPNQPAHSIYKNKLPNYDEVFILLCHMIELYSQKNINTKPLSNSLKNYTTWLESEKKIFNRKRTLKQSDMENKFIELLKTNEFNNILNNEKLFLFIKEIILENKTFDYVKLKLY